MTTGAAAAPDQYAHCVPSEMPFGRLARHMDSQGFCAAFSSQELGSGCDEGTGVGRRSPSGYGRGKSSSTSKGSGEGSFLPTDEAAWPKPCGPPGCPVCAP